MPDPQLPTLLLNDMAYTGSMAGRGVPPRTTEAQPRFAGKGEPGETVVFSIDGQEYEAPVDGDGLWSFTSPELSNEPHAFEMWTRNADGDESFHHEWETTVSANQQEREAQRARNEEWDSTYEEQWRHENVLDPPQGLTPTPVSAGSGGAGGRAAGGAGGGGGATGGASGAAEGASESTGEYPPTPIDNSEKGNVSG